MFFPHTDERFVYTGRWVAAQDCQNTATPGAFLNFCFQGTRACMHFDTVYNQAPLPHLWVSVDGGARTEVPLDRYLRVNADQVGKHTVQVIVKGMVEMFPRWYLPLANKVSFCGVEADELLPLPKPRRRPKTIELVGDSITEGVLIDEDCRYFPTDQLNRPWQDDVTATYGWLMAEALGLTPLSMGYGAVGVTHGGCGGVPTAADAYPYCYAGAPVSYGHPDYVFINHGTNDWGADSLAFTEGYVRLLDVILTAHPKTQVIAMSPFCGAHEEDLEKLVAEYNERHQQHILFVNGAHWLPVEPIHPGREGHRLAAEKLTAILREKLGL